MLQEEHTEDGLPECKKIFLSSWTIEMCMLSLLFRNDTYGYKIAKFDKLQISESTVYPILRRLTKNGYLETYTYQHNGKLRKFYKITPKGIERLNELKNEWCVFTYNVNHLLKEND
jgi:PadR family transcriptional regulator PadR